MAAAEALKEIEIRGVGRFQVPADYSNDQIRAHIQGLRAKKPEIFAAALPDSGNPLSNPAQPPKGVFQQLFGAGARKAVTDTGVGLAKGALKGAGDTFFEAGKRLAANVGGTFVGPNPDVAKAPTPDILVPHNPTEQAGFTGEQIGEYFIPGGAITKGEKAIKAATAGMRGAKAIKLIARPALEAIGMGGVTAIKGGSGEDVVQSAALGGGGALAAEAGKIVAPKIIQKALGIYGREMQHGQTPGAAILKETSALTPGGIAKQAGAKLSELTQELERRAHEAGEQFLKESPKRPLAGLLPAAKADIQSGVQQVKGAAAGGTFGAESRTVTIKPEQRIPSRTVEVPATAESSPESITAALNAQNARRAVGSQAATVPSGVLGKPNQFADTLGSQSATIPQRVLSGGKKYIPPETVPAETATQFLSGGLREELSGQLTNPAVLKTADRAAQTSTLKTLRKIASDQKALESFSATEQAAIRDQVSRLESILEPGAAFPKALPESAPSTKPALGVIDAAIANAKSKNSAIVVGKLNAVRDQLTKNAFTGEAIPERVLPKQILNLKRGVNDLINSWTREEKKGIQPILQKVYGALDKELDRTVPGSAELNQRISSLITGNKAAKATAMGRRRGLVAQIAERAVLPTIGAGVGGYEGGESGAVGGLVGAMALQSPAAKIAAARAINSPFWTMLGRAAAGASAKTERRAR